MAQNLKEFDVIAVPLNGKNLIEASAGTGKTYSIAILALRLVIEKGISIPSLLMVTFTNAAVAELDRRIKKFIVDANNYIHSNKQCDATIIHIIESAIRIIGKDTIKERLKNALILIDELNVLTIHSFCQKTLQEFALETKQLMGTELIVDRNDILEMYFNEFWRQHITTLPISILAQLSIHTFRTKAIKILNLHFSGMTYAQLLSKETLEIYDQEFAIENGTEEYIAKFKTEIAQKLKHYIAENKDNLIDDIKASKLDRSTKVATVLSKSDTIEEFWDFVATYNAADKLYKILAYCLPNEFEKDLYYYFFVDVDSVLFNWLINKAINYVEMALTHHQKKSNYLTYNDIIEKVHKAITHKDNSTLINALKKKYQAVFVDEFQDTDKEQYDIFSTAFATDTILFFIGDPKQSIYAFRKADIATYLQARSFVDNCYSMEINYRSTPSFIESMNIFFKPTLEYDTFHYEQEKDKIDYIVIKSPDNSNKGKLLYNQEEFTSLNIVDKDESGNLLERLAQDIANLCYNNQYTLSKNNTNRQIIPSDIGVLVKNKETGFTIQRALKKLGIPAIVNNDAKIFEHPVSKWVALLLKAIITKEDQAIKAALSHPLFEYTIEDIKRINEIESYALFEDLNETLYTAGITSALLRTLHVMDIYNDWSTNKIKQQDLASFNQLVEIIHQKAYKAGLEPEDILIWLNKGINGQIPEDDSYIQRLESDEEAVQITTIHSSKGLEYNIVMCPTNGFNDNISHKQDTQMYRSIDGRYYQNATSELTEDEKQLVIHQKIQENRRLIYVSITRAVFHCSIYHEYKSRTKNPYDYFISNLKNINTDKIAFNTAIAAHTEDTKDRIQSTKKQIFKGFNSGYLPNNNWSLLSYSKLHINSSPIKYERAENFETDYDKFIYKDLKSSADIGTFIHGILEQIDFQSDKGWNKKIEQWTKKYFPNPKAELFPLLEELLSHITKAPLPTCNHEVFSLKDVNKSKRINEFEFHIPLGMINMEYLQSILNTLYAAPIKTFNYKELDGLMHGFIDMIFEYEGKYYIIDWKSNYLGYESSNYETEALHEAMRTNGYFVQSYIYSVALHQYLKTRITNYDYNKHFGGIYYLFIRGMRETQTTGIYYLLPQKDDIEAILCGTLTT